MGPRDLLTRTSERELPAPSGPHAVGRLAFDLVDESREDPFARRRGTPRRLAVWAWYPAVDGGGAPVPGPYLPGWWRATNWMWGLNASRVRAHAADGAPPATADGGFPLVVFSPSVNPPLLYTALLTALAAHGYVVVGISPTYEVMPLSVFADAPPRAARLAATGGALAAPGKRPYHRDLAERSRIVGVKADDIAFVRSRLTGTAPPPGLPAIDATRSAVIGHSFGGGAAAEICMRPGTPRAGVSIDGALWRRAATVAPETPFLQVFAEHPEFATAAPEAVRQGFFANAEYATEDRATTVGAWQALHEKARPGYTAMVRGAVHTSFCDWPLLPLRSWSPARRALRGRLGPAVYRALTDAVLAFLDRHVRDRDTDVGAVLGADPALRVAAPAELFEIPALAAPAPAQPPASTTS